MSEWFPDRQITDDESEHMLMLLGGIPPVEAGIQLFLGTTYRLAFPEKALVFKNLLFHMGGNFADVLGVPEREGSALFVKGALFYAGVFQTLHPTPNGVPFENDALTQLCELDTLSASWKLSEQIEQLSSYCYLFDHVTRALKIETREERNLALIGSGVVHAVVANSLHIQHMFEEFEQDFEN